MTGIDRLNALFSWTPEGCAEMLAAKRRETSKAGRARRRKVGKAQRLARRRNR